MGKAARRQRQARAGNGADGVSRAEKSRAEAALSRLNRASSQDDVTLASSFAAGLVTREGARRGLEGPPWAAKLDPVETLYMGAATLEEFGTVYEFSNSCTAWLEALRGTGHWDGIARFTREIIAESEKRGYAVDDGDLMFLAVPRLEKAGLHQDKIPERLWPGNLLENARCFRGPDPDQPLPDPVPDADALTAQFWKSAKATGIANDGTAADAMREGLHKMTAAGFDVRASPAALLRSLYASLVTTEYQDDVKYGDMPGSVERAIAWAFGLPPDSPLIPVTDVLITGVNRALTTDGILARLFALPEFTREARPQDRVWHGSPGRTFLTLAFGLGFKEVHVHGWKLTRGDHAGPRGGPLFPLREPRENTADEAGSREPVLFDPATGTRIPFTPGAGRETGAALLREAGSCEAWQYAHQRTGLLPFLDGSFATGGDQDAWDDALRDYARDHGPGTPVDHDAEVARLQDHFIGGALRLSAADPGYGRGLAPRLGAVADWDDDAALLTRHLNQSRGQLLTRLRDDPAVTGRACELARAWSGPGLAAQVRAAHDADDSDVPAVVLFAVAAATQPAQ